MCADISDNELFINNYHLVRLDRDRQGGGIAMYIKNTLSFSIVVSVPELEFIAISSFVGNVCIGLAYRSPSSCVSTYFNSLTNVVLGLQVNIFSNFVFLGDLNVDVSANSFLSSNFCNFLQLFGLHLAKTGHTRVTDTTATTLDILSSTALNSILSCVVIPPLNTSDHNGLLATITCSGAPMHKHQSKLRKVWQYDLADFDKANSMLLDVDVSAIIIDNDVDASWSNLIVCFWTL